ncbi:beta-lactamase family protein [Peribacillus psychrosaccharolyticus]|uniref:Beta-lactamase family protein n=1 Tax=Peribacillus psychrosaccharolyticus TaxID=1407 RepID=A0A974NLI1_PERPY|nr:serine hydrolase domain-containing protein [Peribacillus psychrosaccharolyticus]MEC2054473.1 serine hydrolase [Peribacillus psychrosaccharolyticus]MED3744300.1 serine hydrolase [Peribacillus psychrosaccharolyticus]QQS99782.1 beta-lactamase family protein [Peribacillus psychrosaccharolyticus]
MIASRINELFTEHIQKQEFAGGVCQVSVAGKTMFKEAYGIANKSTNLKMTMNTRFDLASVTKLFTATLILQLISNKRVSLDTSLSEALPAAAENECLAPITIRQLLTHTSGLIAWYPLYTHLPNRDLFSILSEISLSNEMELGSVLYSDLNYILLGEVIKHQLKTTLHEAIQTNISIPLNLATLSYGPINNLAAATEYGNRIERKMCDERDLTFTSWRKKDVPISGEVNDGNAHYFFQGVAGHAGLFGNAADLVKLGEFYLRGGDEIIDRCLIETSMTKQNGTRGLGWDLSETFPIGCGHTGFTGTALWIVPERRLVVALLTNRLNVPTPINSKDFRQTIFSEIMNGGFN